MDTDIHFYAVLSQNLLNERIIGISHLGINLVIILQQALKVIGLISD
jgi:hypothetical protein